MNKIWIICALLFSEFTYAQQGDSVTAAWRGDTTDLAAVVVIQPYVRQADHATESIISDINPFMNAAQRLQRYSGIFVKSTGVSSLNTLSYKGLGSTHIPVVLEGMNLQSSMNGTMDLSLIDGVHYDHTRIEQVGNKVVGGSNLGSSLLLGSIPSTDSSSSLNLRVGASRLRDPGLGLRYKTYFSKSRTFYTLSAFATNAQNRIALNHYGVDGFQSNTDAQKASVMQRVERRVKQRYWSNTTYFQTSKRGVPSSLVAASDGRQQDVNLLNMNVFKFRFGQRSRIVISNQFWNETIDYSSAIRSIAARSNVVNLNSRLDLIRTFKKLKLVVSAGQQAANYRSDNLQNEVNWNRVSIQYRLLYPVGKGSVSLDQQATPYQGKLYTNANVVWNTPWRKQRSKLLLAKVYRLPTLNELYWYEPGGAMGNANLLPEQGYKADWTLSRTIKQLHLALNPYAAWFHRLITWQGFPIIESRNLNRILVYGGALTADYSKSLPLITWNISSNVNWVRSVHRPEDRTQSTYNKQLVYTPLLTGNLTFSGVYRHWKFYVNEQFVGKNYYTSDNSRYLNPYWVTEVGAQYRLKSTALGAVLSNALNAPYFNLPNMPQPGAYLRFNIHHTFNFKP